MSQTQPLIAQRPKKLGRYELVKRLAVGGMAELFLARATGVAGFEKMVVLKRILPASATDDEFVRMFLTEARLAAALGHPNIVHVYDIGHDESDYFFTMEYLHGEDARQILSTLREQGRKLPLQHALTIASGVAAGLHFAHEQIGYDGRRLGIVHRDVSPSNVIVTYGGGVKLVDFGIAKAAERTNLTRFSTLKGKAAYMSPEQTKGGRVDRRSDVFALGILAQELVTNVPVFGEGNELSMMHRVAAADAPKLADVWPECPPQLAQIIARALQRDPADRYQTALEMQLAIEAFAFEARLQLSTAALSLFLTEEFGTKPYPWAGEVDVQREITPLDAGPAPTRNAMAEPDLRPKHTALQTRRLGEPPPSLNREGRSKDGPLRFASLPDEDYDEPTRTEPAELLELPGRPGTRAVAPAPPSRGRLPLLLGAAVVIGGAGVGASLWALQGNDRTAQTRGAPVAGSADASADSDKAPKPEPDTADPSKAAARSASAPGSADASKPGTAGQPPGSTEASNPAPSQPAPGADGSAAATPTPAPAADSDKPAPDPVATPTKRHRRKRTKRNGAKSPASAPAPAPAEKPKKKDPNRLLPY